jgi:hypothetical protein
MRSADFCRSAARCDFRLCLVLSTLIHRHQRRTRKSQSADASRLNPLTNHQKVRATLACTIASASLSPQRCKWFSLENSVIAFCERICAWIPSGLERTQISAWDVKNNDTRAYLPLGRNSPWKSFQGDDSVRSCASCSCTYIYRRPPAPKWILVGCSIGRRRIDLSTDRIHAWSFRALRDRWR